MESRTFKTQKKTKKKMKFEKKISWNLGKIKTDFIGAYWCGFNIFHTDCICACLHLLNVLRANHGRDEAESWAGARANRDGGQEADGGGETAGHRWN